MNRPPVVYRNSRAVAVFFLVPFGVAQDLLQHSGLHAVGFGKFGVLNATWFDYAESSIGAYHEFSLGIVASTEQRRLRLAAGFLSGKKGHLGSFVLALPVDSEVARVGGLEHFGLPKTLAEFRMSWQPSRLSAVLAQDGNPIVSMDLPLGLGLPVQVRDLAVFSRRAGQLITTVIPTRWTVKLDPIGRPSVRIFNRHHPLGQLMSGLDLENARTLVIVHGPLAYAELTVPDQGTEPATENATSQPVGAATPAPTVSSTPTDFESVESPPTPRSAEVSFSPLAVQLKTIPAREPVQPARRDEPETGSCGPESVGPTTVRSRTD